jgi:alkanesulfonate monooxygenase SsuD/methylene tetrahydromethanopterin reductase-like flavin-dependent oxidoreductase (luciferase family)
MDFEVLRLPVGPFARLLAEVRDLEAAGAGAVWLADADGFLEPWSALGALAAETGRIRLGTAATNTSRRDLHTLARQVATVSAIAPGRLEVALGAGDGGRAERIGEAIRLIDGDGVPLHVAANARPGLRLAAELGVGSLTQGDARGLDGVRERNAYLDELGMSGDRLYYAAWADERPFASPDALRAFVEEHLAAGITRILFGYARDAKGGRFLTRETLDEYAPLLAEWKRPDDDEEVRDT